RIADICKNFCRSRDDPVAVGRAVLTLPCYGTRLIFVTMGGPSEDCILPEEGHGVVVVVENFLRPERWALVAQGLAYAVHLIVVPAALRVQSIRPRPSVAGGCCFCCGPRRSVAFGCCFCCGPRPSVVGGCGFCCDPRRSIATCCCLCCGSRPGVACSRCFCCP